MKIGIVIAIVREIKSFLDSDFEVEALKLGNYDYYKTSVNGNEVFIVRSGYGLIDAAAATQFLISSFQVEVILNYGVTGALEPSLKVDDLFVVRRTLNYDYDVSPIDPVKKHQYEEFEDEYIYLDDELISLAKRIRPDLKEATDCSGDRFVEDRELKIRMNTEEHADICDMECAAIARTAWKNGVKFLSVKCISDTFAGDGGDFNTNVTKSAEKAFNLLKEILVAL